MPLAAALMALAALAGNTVVTAAVTDAWEAARKGFARLLGRGDPDKTKLAERRLAETHDQLTHAKGADLDRVRAALEGQWVTRLADLLEDDPGVEADLRALVREIQAQLPAGMMSAADHAVAAGVIHGNVTPTLRRRVRRTPSRARDRDWGCRVRRDCRHRGRDGDRPAAGSSAAGNRWPAGTAGAPATTAGRAGGPARTAGCPAVGR